MRSPTTALLWEIWQRHRWTVAAITGLTVAGRLLDFLERRSGDDASGSSALTTLLGMAAFVLLAAVFNYSQSSRGQGLGEFPRRLFTFPVTSLRLVAIPLLAGIASIELLYLLWMEPLSRGGSASAPFVAMLLAAFMVFYLAALWTLERAGSLRILVLGVVAFALFLVGVLPSFPPAPPPAWRSETVLAGVIAGPAVIAFVLAWHHVARLRAGGAVHRGESLLSPIAMVAPTRRKAFASPAAAHFWFEWRSSGMVLPTLVAGVALLVILPISWLVHSDAAYTFHLLLVALASPIVLAIPVGIAFSKPSFWSEDLAIPAFVAVRPLASEDLVAIKVKVAALSAVLSWMVMIVFLAIWLSSWGNPDATSRLAVQLRALSGQSVVGAYDVAALLVCAGMVLTWRFLVSRLWSGMSGVRPLFIGSLVTSFALVVASLVFDAGRLPGWLVADPARLAPVVWLAAVALIAKCGIATYAWRGVAVRHVRTYLLIWLAGTASLVTLALALWGTARTYLPLDGDGARSLVILVALLGVPLARVGLALGAVARNRHR